MKFCPYQMLKMTDTIMVIGLVLMVSAVSLMIGAALVVKAATHK